MADDSLTKFGCARCWPATPEAAWEARHARVFETDLIDESHFHVMVLACGSCRQRFVSVFTEAIDWVDGDDSQYLTVLPITDAEAAEIVRQGASLNEAHLDAMGPRRRCLQHDHPKGTAERTCWGTGLFVGPYG